jgi:hypothetical protein
VARPGITIVSAVIVPLVVVGTTIALAFAWTDGGRGVLFWTNLGFGVLLEVVLFGYLEMVRRGLRSFTGAFYSIIGVCSLFYISGGVVLLALSWLIPLKAYITAIVLLTNFWIVIGALIAETDSHQRKDREITREKNRKLMNRD